PRERRRGAGARRAGVLRRGALDPARVADPRAEPVSELEARRAAPRLGGVRAPVRRPRVPRTGDADPPLVGRGAPPPDRLRPDRSPRPRALLVRHPERRARPPLAGGRVGRAAGDEPGVERRRPDRTRGDVHAPGGPARRRTATRGRTLRGPPAGRLALRRCAAPRRRAAVRHAHRSPPRELLEPGHAVRPRLGALPRGWEAGRRDPRLHALARLAPARARAGGRLRALRPGSAAADLGDGR